MPGSRKNDLVRQGKQPRGAPKGNSNGSGNVRHGLKAGKLPKNCKHIENQCNVLRRQLEAAVIQLKGEVSLYDAASIQTALKWERHGALALRWLRTEIQKLKPMERLHFSRETARASTERDRAIAALKLDADPVESEWDIIDGKGLLIEQRKALTHGET